ncbi:hypothetical protein ST47_g7211 [Ascochyta rabiei]|uniref:Uncharacterized protein n=1 Tax=Didymella rabiei TaxID=5454 RepID=A0A163B5Y4_DIDRA|nr:hypothetical protein ST47_g7211 [Ascochyta rabiei]
MTTPIPLQAPVAPVQSIHGASSDLKFGSTDADMLDPVYFGPTDTQTSTIHITITASIPPPKPRTSPLEQSAVTSEVTSSLVKTVRLPSPTPQSSQTIEPSQTPEPSSAPESSLNAVHTTILSADPRCPYPFPGVYCGKPKTTLVSETRRETVSATHATASMGGNEKPKVLTRTRLTATRTLVLVLVADAIATAVAG